MDLFLLAVLRKWQWQNIQLKILCNTLQISLPIIMYKRESEHVPPPHKLWVIDHGCQKRHDDKQQGSWYIFLEAGGGAALCVLCTSHHKAEHVQFPFLCYLRSMWQSNRIIILPVKSGPLLFLAAHRWSSVAEAVETISVRQRCICLWSLWRSALRPKSAEGHLWEDA